MFSFKRFKIFEVFGIPVYLDWSTIIIALMFLHGGDILLALGMTVLLLLSIVLHELGHSLTARIFGCNTRDITLSVIGGCASLERMPYKAYQELLTAAAGPCVSFILGLAMVIGSMFMPERSMLTIAIYIAGQINFTLGLFNLLPGFPMDGGRIFRSAARFFMSRSKATYYAMVVGRVAAVLLVVLPLLGITSIWIIPIGGSFFLRLLIAYMIWTEGFREYRASLMEESFRGWTQDDFDARVSPPPYER